MTGSGRSDPTDDTHSRRRFLAGTTLAALGVGAAGVATGDPGFDDPFALGVASGDPQPESVVLWTRLAPEPLARAGGMADESVPVEWRVAEDRGMEAVVASGTALAEPGGAHAVHVVPEGLDPGTEYFYRFRAGGYDSPVGRTKTAPEPDEPLEQFTFAFASCQAWTDGFYTAYRHMAAEELDLVVHLGDYVYEYPVGPEGGVRGTATPPAYRTEARSLERYRRQYALYRSDPDLRAAHASAPWLVTRDDHEVDNNYAGDVPQDPDRQPPSTFRERRAAAYRAHYEHMPLRPADRPDGPDQELYRRYRFGELVALDALDTRQYRSDQPCEGLVGDCRERLAADRTILGTEQREWLRDAVEESETTWEAVANQVPMASMDLEPGPGESFRLDQWDGYVDDREAVTEAFAASAATPVVVTGDVHRNWANEVRRDDETVAAEFVGSSISSGGDGYPTDPAGRFVVRENDNVHYYNAQRGYVRCRLTPESWTTDYRVVARVSDRGAPVRTDRRFRVAAGSPGLD